MTIVPPCNHSVFRPACSDMTTGIEARDCLNQCLARNNIATRQALFKDRVVGWDGCVEH